MTRNFHLSFDSITWFLLCHWPKYLAQYILLPPRPPEVSPAHAGSRSSERRRPPPSELCLLVLRTLSASSENFGRGFWELWSWVLRTCFFLLLCGFYVYLQYCPQVLRTWSDTSENLVRYFWELWGVLLRTWSDTSENFGFRPTAPRRSRVLGPIVLVRLQVSFMHCSSSNVTQNQLTIKTSKIKISSSTSNP